MTLKEFIQCLRDGLFTDDDGIAEIFIPARESSRLRFSPSEFPNLRIRWFNK